MRKVSAYEIMSKGRKGEETKVLDDDVIFCWWETLWIVLKHYRIKVCSWKVGTLRNHMGNILITF